MAACRTITRRLVPMLVSLAFVGANAVAAPPAAKPAKPAQKEAPSDFKMVLEPKAMDLLKAASARLAAAKSMSFTATVSYEFPSKLGPAIVYTSRYDVTLQRPDKLKVLMPGDGPASEFYYDGKAMMAYAPAEDLVAVADAPPTIDAMLKAAYDTASIYYPFSDLIVADPYAALTDHAKLAFYIGPSGNVGGTKTDMVAWANDDVFIQIWIGVDDKLPRRMRAVYSDDPLRLRHELDLSNWQLDGNVTADAFTSQKARAAKSIAFDKPVVAQPVGEKPLPLKKADKDASKSSKSN
ncbi:MAG: DUF2092 domain-containing protein [Rhodanobacteraceae bacterium]